MSSETQEKVDKEGVGQRSQLCRKGTEGTNKEPSAQAEASVTVGNGDTWGGEKTGWHMPGMRCSCKPLQWL